jgi:transcriptional regulator with XRE-family HTH domain
MFGQRLKALRQNAGLTQTEVAKKLDLSASTIAMYERGERDPDTGTLSKLAQLFDCSTDYLLGRVDHPERALIGDLPQALQDEGVRAIQVVKEAVLEGLTADELADILKFVKKMNRKKD